MSNLYAEDILYWAKDTRFRGTLESTSAKAHRENPSCGDSLTCTVRLTTDSPLAPSLKEGEVHRIGQVRFDGMGCVICLAAATVLAEHVEGMGVEMALATDRSNMVEWLACDVGPMRTNCMMLALLTLRDALLARHI